MVTRPATDSATADGQRRVAIVDGALELSAVCAELEEETADTDDPVTAVVLELLSRRLQRAVMRLWVAAAKGGDR